MFTRKPFRILRLLNAALIASLILTACSKDVRTFSDIHFSLVFDAEQQRLDNLGNPSEIPTGHAAQIPDMQFMSIHYLEISQDETVPFKGGALLFQAPETEVGGAGAIDFAQSKLAIEGEDFLQVNVERLPPGTYEYVRASVAYQQFGVAFDLHNIPVVGSMTDQTGVLASFVGYRTYIGDLTIQNLTTSINQNKDQGFWGFETLFAEPYTDYNAIYTGQSPAGSTTVVNPIDATSPIPNGSCVVTGAFTEPLVIMGDEAGELYITLSFSINNSFEWIDTDADGKWDIDALDPGQTEEVVDMGVRGLIPEWSWKE